jgi:hypothetical protein
MERIRLALQLFLFSGQVFGTPWLTTPLRKGKIVFRQTYEGAESWNLSELDLKAHPFILINDPFQTDSMPGGAQYSRECLLALGILLLELWHAVTFESILNETELFPAESNIWVRLGHALRWHGESKYDIPVPYSEAVIICLTFRATNTGRLEDERRQAAEICASVAELVSSIVTAVS